MIYAEDVNFWKSGVGPPEKWIIQAVDQITKLGGVVVGHAYGTGERGNAYMIGFRLGDDSYKVIWPVLPLRYTYGPKQRQNEQAARVQAATALHHYCKAVCLYAAVVGPRAAFFSHLLLPDGRTAAQATSDELAHFLPPLLGGPA